MGLKITRLWCCGVQMKFPNATLDFGINIATFQARNKGAKTENC